MLDAIATPFGWLMRQLYELTNNFGVAIILFSLIVAIVLLPFMAKSKKGMMRMTRLQPKLMELQRKHEGNQQKLNEEIAKLYRQEKASPMGGCLWSLLPFPILLALYRAVIRPITLVMGVSEELLAEGGALYERLAELGFSLPEGVNSFYAQIYQSEFITAHFDQFADISDKLIPMDYNFLGLNLAATPDWHFWQFDFSAGVWPVLGLFLLPVISTALNYLSMFISQKVNANPAASTAQTQSTNKMMLWMMPLITLWMGFTLPASMSVYWIMNSVTGIVRDTALTAYYQKKLDAEDAVRRAEERVREEELERKRQETERLRAMNATTVNKNTSKKKQQAQAKQSDTERRAAAEREERAARRERLGVKEEEKPASQVGNRRYARGRAYVEDRFTNPEGAEAATAAAAAESEFGESLDADMPDAADTAAADIPAGENGSGKDENQE